MDEEKAKIVADVLGGETWNSGGEIYLVVNRRADGSMVVFSDEVVCEYESEDAFDACNPRQSILLV